MAKYNQVYYTTQYTLLPTVVTGKLYKATGGRDLWKMGKKETVTKGTNVENYRKRIGKQDYKKSKGALKSVQDTAHMKRSSTGLQDTILVAIAFAVALAFVYTVLYMSMSKYQGDGE